MTTDPRHVAAQPDPDGHDAPTRMNTSTDAWDDGRTWSRDTPPEGAGDGPRRDEVPYVDDGARGPVTAQWSSQGGQPYPYSMGEAAPSGMAQGVGPDAARGGASAYGYAPSAQGGAGQMGADPRGAAGQGYDPGTHQFGAQTGHGAWQGGGQQPMPQQRNAPWPQGPAQGFGPGQMRSVPGPGGIDPMTGEPLSDKSKVVAGLLQFFLGIFGVGRFYIGDNRTGFIQLALGVVGFFGTLFIIGFPILLGVSIWAFIDSILMLTGSVRDPYGRKLS